MSSLSSKKRDKQSIYEMFRACRLCGAGGGYKMPIIQNIVDLGDNELKLKEKIKECVQIDVQPDDKMPPLICELCIDKINEFHDFIQLCQLTNTKTRTVLGLPLKSSNNNSESDCIFGRLSPIRHHESEDELIAETKVKMKKGKGGKGSKLETPKNNQNPEPNTLVTPNSKTVTLKTKTDASKTKSKTDSKAEAAGNTKRKSELNKLKEVLPLTKSKLKADLPLTKSKLKDDLPLTKSKLKDNLPLTKSKLKADLLLTKSKLTIKPRSPSPSPKRVTRKSNETEEPRIKVKDEYRLKKEQLPQVEEKHEKPRREAKKRPLTPQPEAVIEKPRREAKKRPLTPQPQEVIEKPKCKKRPLEPSAPSKSTPPPPSKKAKVSQKPRPKPQKKAATPPPTGKEYECEICKMKFKSLGGHMKSHDVLYTEMRLSCRPCADWFSTVEEANTHHKEHKSPDMPYRCQRCCGEFPLIKDYDEHVVDYCPPYFESEPDIKCESCWNEYPTQLMYDEHKCLGEDGRPGGKCTKCKHFYPLLKDLQKHEPTCDRLKCGDILAKVELDVIKSLRGVQIRFTKCDTLLNRAVGDSYDVSKVKPNHGLDKQKVYPYNALHQGLKLKTEPNAMVKIPSLYIEHNNLHWDIPSDTDVDESGAKVKTLSDLCLKVVHFNKLLGKMEIKKRIKSTLSEFDDKDEQKHTSNVDDLISNLNDDDKNDEGDVKNGDVDVKNDEDDDKNYDFHVKNYDVDDKNDDITSKSSLEIDISQVRSFQEFGVSDSAVNDVSASENIESQLSDSQNNEVNDLNMKMDVDENIDDTSLSTKTQDNHNTSSDYGIVSEKMLNGVSKDDEFTTNGDDKTDSHDNVDDDDKKNR